MVVAPQTREPVERTLIVISAGYSGRHRGCPGGGIVGIRRRRASVTLHQCCKIRSDKKFGPVAGAKVDFEIRQSRLMMTFLVTRGFLITTVLETRRS